MLPGTKYSTTELLQLARRRWWVLLAGVSLGAAVAIGASRMMPDLYRSEELIMVEPQRVPAEYVKSIDAIGIDDRLLTLEGQILSRSRLERIIQDLNLYEEMRRTTPMETVVDVMRSDIDLKIDTKASFRVGYVSHDAVTAQRVAQRLGSLFIEETLKDRETAAEDTNGFLDSQLEDAKRRLIEHEKRLEAYRTRYGNELPSQSAMNLQAMQNAQARLQALVDDANHDRERRLLLERQLADLESAAPGSTTGAQSAAGSGSTEQQLAAAQAALQALLTRTKPTHPDAKDLQRKIRDLQAQMREEASRPAPAPVPSESTKASDLQQERRVRDVKLQIADIDRQLAEKQEQEKLVRSSIGEYEYKLSAVPKRESELIELTRDYTTLQSTYQGLLAKRQDAQLSANLERRNIGPQFKVLDPARIPERPFSPNRLVINLGGAAAGLVLGALAILLLELGDSTFKREQDVLRVLNLRVLAQIPVMVTSFERRRRTRQMVLTGIALAAGLGIGAAAAVTSHWLPHL